MGSEKQNRRPDDPVAVVALTRRGVELGRRLKEALGSAVLFAPERLADRGDVSFGRLADVFPGLWEKYRSIVCVMAAGIVVRLIAPLLRGKTSDPAVVVMDEQGRHAISLLSGHIGGANRLAGRVAKLVGARAVITTASDVRSKPAIDLIAEEEGLKTENPRMAPRVARALIEDEPLWVFDPDGRLSRRLVDAPGVRFVVREHDLPKIGPGGAETPGVWVSERSAPAGLRCLKLRPLNLVVGIGCNRGTDSAEILGLLHKTFKRMKLSPMSIRNLASIDLKADEAGLNEAAEALGRPVFFYSPDEIKDVPTPNPSRVVARHVGVQSVCEAAALLSAQKGTLIVQKQKTPNVTLAVVRVDYRS